MKIKTRIAQLRAQGVRGPEFRAAVRAAVHQRAEHYRVLWLGREADKQERIARHLEDSELAVAFHTETVPIDDPTVPHLQRVIGRSVVSDRKSPESLRLKQEAKEHRRRARLLRRARDAKMDGLRKRAR